MGDSDGDEGDSGYTCIFDDEPDKVLTFLPPKDGKARAKWPNNDTYYGDYKDGKRHGKGLYTLASGSTYDGEYVENKKQGWGIFTAPDGGKYTGEWLQDKRHGKGTYNYRNKDSYTGEWANGTKHGWGTYVYAHLSSSLSGTWSNGLLVDGSWQVHDGSKYVGSFLSNQPAGEGLIKFPSGAYASGQYANQKFVAEFFKRVHPNARPPERVQPDVFKKACRAIDKCTSKGDHNNAMHTLKETIKGCPNFRRIGTSPVYVCGQPSVDGFKAAVEEITGAGLEKVTWVNNRAEPLVYVNSLPFAPRDRRELVKPLKLDGITVPQIAELENRFMENIKFMAKKKGGLHYFHEDFTDPTDPLVSRIELKTTEVVEPDAIKSIQQVYDAFAEEDLPIAYQRIPMPRSGPTTELFDEYVALVRDTLDGGALVLNDTLGKGTSQYASVIGYLLTNKGGGGEEEAEAEEGGGDEGDEGDTAEKKPVVEMHVYNPEAPDTNLGEFNIIMKLVDSLNGPDPEEERKRLEEEARVKKEEEDRIAAEAAAKAAAEAELAAAENPDGEAGEGEAKEGEEAAGADEGDEGDKKDGDEGEDKKEDGDEGDEAAAGGETEEAKEPEKPKNPPDYGTKLKEKVDAVLDKCGTVLHMIKNLNELRNLYDKCENTDEKAALKATSLDLIETYFNYIKFACYIDKKPEFDQTFKAWCETEENIEIFSILGTREGGALAEFNWV